MALFANTGSKVVFGITHNNRLGFAKEALLFVSDGEFIGHDV
jgi:hypothetical protein